MEETSKDIRSQSYETVTGRSVSKCCGKMVNWDINKTYDCMRWTRSWTILVPVVAVQLTLRLPVRCPSRPSCRTVVELNVIVGVLSDDLQLLGHSILLKRQGMCVVDRYSRTMDRLWRIINDLAICACEFDLCIEITFNGLARPDLSDGELACPRGCRVYLGVVDGLDDSISI